MNDRLTNQDALAELKNIVCASGIRAALKFLNGLTTHRFTALYRFDNPLLKNLFFFDREHPEQNSSPEIPILSSYCVFVRDSNQMFCVNDSLDDQRTEGHPKRLEIRAYCGVPLIDRYGNMFGTICHFDEYPRSINQDDVELMEKLADVLQTQVSSIK